MDPPASPEDPLLMSGLSHVPTVEREIFTKVCVVTWVVHLQHGTRVQCILTLPLLTDRHRRLAQCIPLPFHIVLRTSTSGKCTFCHWPVLHMLQLPTQVRTIPSFFYI
jgi:hypothetical protein